MLWATNIGWHERLASASGFAKLLAIPLLLSQFYRSNNGKWVLLGFTISATALLTVSWSLVLLGVSRPNHQLGVPVKDHITPGGKFWLFAL